MTGPASSDRDGSQRIKRSETLPMQIRRLIINPRRIRPSTRLASTPSSWRRSSCSRWATNWRPQSLPRGGDSDTRTVSHSEGEIPPFSLGHCHALWRDRITARDERRPQRCVPSNAAGRNVRRTPLESHTSLLRVSRGVLCFSMLPSPMSRRAFFSTSRLLAKCSR